MIKVLARIFIKKHHDTDDLKVRADYIALIAVCAVVLNLLLFTLKIFLYFKSGAVSVRADGFNNLADALVSLVSLVGIKLSVRPADREHPFGHGRIESLAAFLMANLILLTGFSVAKEALFTLFKSREIVISSYIMFSLAVSSAVKFCMFFMYRKYSLKFESDLLRSSSVDSLSDAFITAITLTALALSSRFNLGFNADSALSAVIAVFIIRNGIEIIKDTSAELIGKAPSPELCEKIKEICLSYPGVLNVHDILVHSYGHSRIIASLHAEVDSSLNIFDLHESIDNAEREISDKLNVLATIHLDPIDIHDEMTDFYKKKLAEILKDDSITFHDLRIVNAKSFCNVIFDLAVPFDEKRTEWQLRDMISSRLNSSSDKPVNVVITFDRT